MVDGIAVHSESFLDAGGSIELDRGVLTFAWNDAVMRLACTLGHDAAPGNADADTDDLAKLPEELPQHFLGDRRVELRWHVSI